MPPLESSSSEARPAHRGAWAGYREAWRRTPAALGILFFSLPYAVVVFSILQVWFWFGVGTLVIVAGLFVLVGGLFAASLFGNVWARLIGAAVGRPIAEPRSVPARRGGVFARSWAQLGRADRWRALLHGAFAHLVLAIPAWSLMITCLAIALGGPTAWIWMRAIPRGDRNIYLSEVIWNWATGTPLPIDRVGGDILLYAIIGVIFLLSLPLVFRGLALAEWWLAYALLGETSGDRLRREVAELENAREMATAEEHRTLGQLERDLHDGPQQRLVRLQMDLAAAERRMQDDPGAVPALLAEARTTAGTALGELRALSRGVAPPILSDRGLHAALEALAAEAPIPTRLHGAPEELTGLSEANERTLYFVAAECVANAAKHSGAERVDLTPAVDGGWVTLTVEDGGLGGALLLPGHGLLGLRQRVQGVGGELDVSSPEGGPTRIVARIPVSLRG